MRAWAGEGSLGETGHATGRVSVYSQRGQTRRNGKSGITSHHSASQSGQSVISIIPLLAPLTADDL